MRYLNFHISEDDGAECRRIQVKKGQDSFYIEMTGKYQMKISTSSKYHNNTTSSKSDTSYCILHHDILLIINSKPAKFSFNN